MRVSEVKEEELMVQDVPETDTSGAAFTLIVLSVTDVSVSVPAVVDIRD